MIKKRDVFFYFATACLCFFILMFLRFVLGVGESKTFNQLLIADKFILILGVSGAFAFWFSMLAHFFSNGDLRHKVLWGFGLILFSWLVSLIYFFVHFLPSENPMRKQPR